MATVAQHHGRCTECEHAIVPGQRIETIDDEEGWVHVDCAHRRPVVVACTCSRCMVVHTAAML